MTPREREIERLAETHGLSTIEARDRLDKYERRADGAPYAERFMPEEWKPEPARP